ncbi:hypothetical protein NIES4071_84120 [Calothrix sp. NIES-4071]|nr:hypothetical protein NIES4071_84120 [Calothrix sp. NIES-4071]BAZ62680.1 hypothetical protein NIES4105_84050 [Calothrix sp. NIES-4105]
MFSLYRGGQSTGHDITRGLRLITMHIFVNKNVFSDTLLHSLIKFDYC